MSADILVRPSDPDFVGERVRADLRTLRDAVDTRFPEGTGPGATGALADRPILAGDELVVRPELLSRPLVLNAVMRRAAPLQLTVHAAELGVPADPRHRVDLDVHLAPSTAHAAFAEHEVLGRVHGTLPWVTRPMLDHVVAGLTREGDHVVLEATDDRWLRLAREGDRLGLRLSDGADRPVRTAGVAVDGAGEAQVVAVAWHWAACDRAWESELDWSDEDAPDYPMVG